MTLSLNELFLYTSLDASASCYVEHKAFPKEWLEMQAFLEKVFLVSCIPLLHDVIAKILK